MTVYLVQEKNPLKFGVMIESFREGARQPAILVSEPQNGFPADSQSLATNFANLLNGGVAQERPATDGRAVHYQKHDHGVTLYHRDPEAGGVSVPGLHFTLIDSLPKQEQSAVLGKLTAHFMREFCGALETRKNVDLGNHAPTVKNAPGL